MIENYDGYGSHIPVLDTVLKFRPINSVIEFGGGDFSTPWFIKNGVKDLITIESMSQDWYDRIRKEYHPNVRWVPEHDQLLDFCKVLNTEVDLMFIDTHENLRWQIVDRVQEKTKIIVFHDTEEALYHLDLITLKPGWVYFEYMKYRPWTGVFTNDIELIKCLSKELSGSITHNMTQKNYLK